MLGKIGFPELLLIFGVLLLLFGAKRLPELARSIGRGINELRSGLKESDKPADEKKTDQTE